MEEEIKEPEKTITAKSSSLWGQIIASVWIAGWNAAQFIMSLVKGEGIDCGDIIVSGVAIAGCFAPVYLNLLVDKIKEIKLGGTK